MNSKKAKQKFCFISPSFFFERTGGTEIQNWYIAHELIERKWEVHYVRETRVQNPRRFFTNGILLHSIPRLRKQLRLMIAWKLSRIMKTIRADIMRLPSSWFSCTKNVTYV